jgi:hypothetical protein
VAGRVDDVPLPSKHAVLGSWLNSEGIANDGMVPTWSSVLPGNRHVVVDGLGHTGSVLDHLFAKPTDRIALTKAVLVLAFDTQ